MPAVTITSITLKLPTKHRCNSKETVTVYQKVRSAAGPLLDLHVRLEEGSICELFESLLLLLLLLLICFLDGRIHFFLSN